MWQPEMHIPTSKTVTLGWTRWPANVRVAICEQIEVLATGERLEQLDSTAKEKYADWFSDRLPR